MAEDPTIIEWIKLPRPRNPDVDRTLQFNDTVISHNKALQATSVEITPHPDEPQARPFRLWVADELKPRLTPLHCIDQFEVLSLQILPKSKKILTAFAQLIQTGQTKQLKSAVR